MYDKNLKFQNFLLNESKFYLGHKIGDILSALQELQQNSDGMGTRQIVANSDRIVNQIKRILHGNWSSKDEKHLKKLQIVGVALAKAIDKKDNLIEIIPNVVSALEELMSKMGQPVNSLGVSDQDSETEEPSEDELGPSKGKEDKKNSAKPPQNPQNDPSSSPSPQQPPPPAQN